MEHDSLEPEAARQFEDTHWSVVIAAAGGPAASGATAALATLCRHYWYPLYGFVRRRGYGHHDAEDLTQAFFTTLLEKNYLADANQERGKFRTFLLAAMKHYLANDWNRHKTKKRGGAFQFVPFDEDSAERYEIESSGHEMTPEEHYERRWAMTVLEQGMQRLRNSYKGNDQQALFEALKPSLIQGDGEASLAEIADSLGMNPGALKVAAHRLRRRFRKAIREEIENTVASPDDVEAEFEHLRNTISRC